MMGRSPGSSRGALPIYEPGLEEIVRRCAADGRLTFTTDLAAAVSESEVVFIAVGTPAGEDGGAELSAVEEVARGIGAAIGRYTVVVNKSTVPVGTGTRVREIVERYRRATVDFDVVSNPEFLREGSAVEDTLRPRPDRHRCAEPRRLGLRLPRVGPRPLRARAIVR